MTVSKKVSGIGDEDAGRRLTTHDYISEQTVTLKDYFESRICSFEETVKERFASQAIAVTTALAANEKRLDGMNEFRATLRDQNDSFVNKSEFSGLATLINTRFSVLEKEIRAIELSNATIAGKASQNAVIGAYGIAALGIIISIVKLLLG